MRNEEKVRRTRTWRNKESIAKEKYGQSIKKKTTRGTQRKQLVGYLHQHEWKDIENKKIKKKKTGFINTMKS